MRPVSVITVLSLLLAASAQAAEWPQFRADALHSGAVESQFALPTDRWWSQSTGGPIEGSPVVSDGRVFVGSTDGKVYAFDAISGSPLWKYDVSSPISGTPALSGGILYVVANDGKMFALDAVTGKQRLSAGMGSPPPGATRTSPALHEGRLYVGTEEGVLVAYNLQTLTKDWEFRVSEESEAYQIVGSPTNATSFNCRPRFAASAIRSSPAIFDDRVYFGSDSHALFAVDEFGLGGSQSGKTRGAWTGTSLYTCSGATTTGTGGTLLPLAPLYPMLGDVIRASPAIDPVNKLVIVASYDNTVRAFDIATGAQKWNYSVAESGRDSRVISTPAIAGGKVFFGSFNGKFYALTSTASSVSQAWNFTAGDAIWSSPAVSNNLVAFGADDETIYVLDATNGEKKWSQRVGGDVRSSPAIWTGEYLGQPITGGVLYVGGSDGILYAFGGAKPPLPDLKVRNITYPTPPPLDGDADIVVEVVNAGNSTAPATEMKLFINDALASTQPVLALAPGEVANLTYRWHVTAGEHNLKAQVDPAGLSREFDRANNELLVKTPTAQAPPPPPPPPSEQEQEQQQEAPKKKSPGVEAVAFAGVLGLVALLSRRRKR